MLRPVPILDPAQAADAPRRIAGGGLRYRDVALFGPGGSRRIVSADEIAREGGPAADALARIEAPRGPIAGLAMDRPRIMAVLNVTPDSFSDGGRFAGVEAAADAGAALVADGADILDIGGESTRPGAEPVPVDEEIARVVPVIVALRTAGLTTPISVDTRKAAVARAALSAGADLFNDVSALTHDAASAGVAAAAGADLCLMHAQGDPKTMQLRPRYDDVTAEVAAFLSGRIEAAVAAGAARAGIAVDPGIGFGKTPAHNMTLIRELAALHATGAPILLGVSRKRFIGVIADEDRADRRAPGSIAAALLGVAQGAQILRVHDVAETRQALEVWLETSGLWDESAEAGEGAGAHDAAVAGDGERAVDGKGGA